MAQPGAVETQSESSDSLERYRSKRDFRRTPEPAAVEFPSDSGPLRFVVQEHQARRLHYDFRLEIDGVLKSWAVPKGPSLDPGQKRLARQVEDHPLDYRNFEGLIAPGNYGAGAVIVWDEGTLQAPGSSNRQESEKRLRQGLESGDLKFVLDGQKLKGEFALVRMKGKGDDQWLLIKKKDPYAAQGDILQQDRSVQSGKTLEMVKAEGENEPGKSRRPKGQKDGQPEPSSVTLVEESGSSQFVETLLLGGARRATMPEGTLPMLASLADEPFDLPGWLYELKWDGFRAIAEVNREGVRLHSRSGKDLEKEFAPIMRELHKLPFEAVLDGELVVVDSEGRSEFRLLQHYRKTGEGTLVYYLFDLLYLDGYDLQALPLARRKAILKEALPDLPRLKYSTHREGEGLRLFQLALQNGLEGIIAKDASSPYRPGVRSAEWLKFKTHHRQEAVIGGFTEPKGSRPEMGALLLGVWEGKDLVYVGHTGGGFADVDLAEVHARLQPLARPDTPFRRRPKTNAPATWVEPELVCEVRFADWTKDGMMRMPVFMGLREDLDPRQVRREQPVPVIQTLSRKKMTRKRAEPQEIIEIDGRRVALSNLEKLYWPDDGLSKGDMLAYYRAMAPFLLPYLRDRPENLHRFPNGIGGKRFYQKNITEVPDWIQTVAIPSESGPEVAHYLVCQDEATLVFMANLGTIEINPWNSRLESLDNPDYLAIDLDPNGRSFDDVLQVALAFHALLDGLEVPALVKTSGQSGLHIFVPLGAQYTYEQVRQFALLLNRWIHNRFPDTTSLERSPRKRQKKIYLDYLQNRWGQTMAAPYSLRPRPGAPVSTPLQWSEVQPGLDPRDFNIHSVPARVQELGELWQGVLGPGIDMQRALNRLELQWNQSIPRQKGKDQDD